MLKQRQRLLNEIHVTWKLKELQLLLHEKPDKCQITKTHFINSGESTSFTPFIEHSGKKGKHSIL